MCKGKYIKKEDEVSECFVYSSAGHYVQLGSVFLFYVVFCGAESMAVLWKTSIS